MANIQKPSLQSLLIEMRFQGQAIATGTDFMASEPDVDFGGRPVFLIDCRSRPGQSGSAVIAYRSAGTVAMKDGGAAIFSGPVTKFLGV